MYLLTYVLIGIREEEMITKEQFEKYHQDCIAMWTYLAETGAEEKPDSDYLHRCAACEIAINVMPPNCFACPVDVWRKVAEKYFPTDAPCESDPKSPYKAWLNAETPGERKRAARRIAKLKWSYLEEYGRG
jgi:hypothetical protein